MNIKFGSDEALTFTVQVRVHEMSICMSKYMLKCTCSWHVRVQVHLHEMSRKVIFIYKHVHVFA